MRDLDLTVAPGEIVALLGPNGAGKTTTLLTLAGELAPLQGEVRVLGQPAGMSLQRLVRRGLGFVPEERAVISSLNTSANLKLSRGDMKRGARPVPGAPAVAPPPRRAAVGR